MKQALITSKSDVSVVHVAAEHFPSSNWGKFVAALKVPNKKLNNTFYYQKICVDLYFLKDLIIESETSVSYTIAGDSTDIDLLDLFITLITVPLHVAVSVGSRKQALTTFNSVFTVTTSKARLSHVAVSHFNDRMEGNEEDPP